MRLPSTRTLRAFLLAARTGSFKHAAHQLCLTPSAVSYRVKALEEAVGVQLFRRGVREVTLTEAGCTYFGAIDALFKHLDTATRELRSRYGRRSLRVRVAPFFASEFLLPRLGRLSADHSDLDLRIDTDGSRTAGSGEADASIVLGSGPWSDVQSLRLCGESYVPACAPALVVHRPIRAVDELNRHTLLVHAAREDAWERWAHAAGFEAPRPRKRVCFDTLSELAHAAEQGIGVGLIPMPLGVERLRARSLLQLFDHALETPESYFLLHKREAAARPQIAVFRAWLLREIGSVASERRAPLGAREPKQALPGARTLPTTLAAS